MDDSKTFIEQARRKQIIDAAIVVLANYGYLNATFSKIAAQAGINSGLISYHFRDKDELMRETLRIILAERAATVANKIAAATTATDKIRVLIESDIAAICAHPEPFQAAAEIMFSLRNTQGALTYLGADASPLFSMLLAILEKGVASGEFGKIDTYHTALLIDGARDSFLAQLGKRPGLDVEKFTHLLYGTVMLMVHNTKE